MGKLTISTLYYLGYSAKHNYTRSQFLSDLSGYLNSLCTDEVQIVTGNFNVHYENLDKDGTKVLGLHEILLLKEFIQLVNDKTHKGGGILGLVLVNAVGLKLVNKISLFTDYSKVLSDHIPIFFDLKMISDKNPKKYKTMLSKNLKLLDMNAFKKCISIPLSHDMHAKDTINDYVKSYNIALQQSLDFLAPTVEKRIKM